jgi:hypothetical protein
LRRTLGFLKIKNFKNRCFGMNSDCIFCRTKLNTNRKDDAAEEIPTVSFLLNLHARKGF